MFQVFGHAWSKGTARDLDKHWHQGLSQALSKDTRFIKDLDKKNSKDIWYSKEVDKLHQKIPYVSRI